jgi:hypothetical protein
VGLNRRDRIGQYVGSSTSGGVLYIDSSNQLAQAPTQIFWDAVNNRFSLGTTSNYTAKLNILAGSTTEKGLVIRSPGSYATNYAEIQDNSGNVQLCIDSNYALATTATSTTQQIQVRSRTGMGGVGGNFTFEVLRDGTNNSGNGAIIKLTDNTVSAYIKWVANGFTQYVLDLEFWNANGKVYAAPNSGGNFYYNPVQNTTDISILQIPTQTMYPGAGTSSPQGLSRVKICPIAASSPNSVTDVASQWIEGAPTQGVNMTITRRIASLIHTGDAGGYAQIIRGANGQSVNVSEWQDYLNATWLSVDSAYRLNLHAQNEIRFQDSTGGEYAAIKAPATIGTSYTLTLPTTDGGVNEYLKSDGSGGLSWDTPAGGSTPSMARHFAFMGA